MQKNCRNMKLIRKFQELEALSQTNILIMVWILIFFCTTIPFYELIWNAKAFIVNSNIFVEFALSKIVYDLDSKSLTLISFIILISLSVVNIFKPKTISLIIHYLFFINILFFLGAAPDNGISVIKVLLLINILTSLATGQEWRNAFLKIMQYQIVAIYLFAGIYKLCSFDWMSGIALTKILIDSQWSLVSNFSSQIKESFLVLLNYIIIIFELTTPLLLVKKTRKLYMITAFLFQIGSIVTLGLFSFSFALLIGINLFKDSELSNVKTI